MVYPQKDEEDHFIATDTEVKQSIGFPTQLGPDSIFDKVCVDRGAWVV